MSYICNDGTLFPLFGGKSKELTGQSVLLITNREAADMGDFLKDWNESGSDQTATFARTVTALDGAGVKVHICDAAAVTLTFTAERASHPNGEKRNKLLSRLKVTFDCEEKEEKEE